MGKSYGVPSMNITLDEFSAYLELKSLVARIARGEIDNEDIVTECKKMVADLVDQKLY